MSAGIDALCASPDFDHIIFLRQCMATPDRGMIADVVAVIHCCHFVSFDDADFVIVHNISPIAWMGIRCPRDKGIPEINMIANSQRFCVVFSLMRNISGRARLVSQA